jgi:hypothetical protein
MQVNIIREIYSISINALLDSCRMPQSKIGRICPADIGETTANHDIRRNDKMIRHRGGHKSVAIHPAFPLAAGHGRNAFVKLHCWLTA